MIITATCLLRKFTNQSSYSVTQFSKTLTALHSCATQVQSYSSKMSTEFCAAYVTVPNMEVAKKISRGIVSNKLAACVNVIPGVTSIYEWEGKIEEDSELILMIKTRCSRTEELTEFVKSNHPYDVCEVITTPITGGNPAYLSWLGDVVKNE